MKENEYKEYNALTKGLLENGYESLKEFSTDRRHADKWLGPERIAEPEKLRQEKKKESKNSQYN